MEKMHDNLFNNLSSSEKETNKHNDSTIINEDYNKEGENDIEEISSIKYGKNEIEIDNINSENIGIFKKIPRKTMNYSKKNKNTKKSVMTRAVQEQIGKNFSLDNLGQINLAEDHRSANRPLNKINDFNKKTKFCQCCNLPCIQEGVIEPFKYCDSIKKFAICGKGVYLYFFYTIFALFCFLIIILISSMSFNFLSRNYLNNIIDLCKSDNTIIVKKCQKYKINNTFWSYKYSIDIIKIYGDICLDLVGNEKVCNKTIINYSVINCFSMISLFMFHLVCIYIFYYINIKLNEGMLPSDYTLLISNLNSFYRQLNVDNKNQINIEQFLSELEKQLFKTKEISTINSINICYKINEYMKIQKKCEEYKTKIFHIKYNPYQRKKNEELKIHNINEKCYFYMPLSFLGCTFSFKKGESLELLNQKKQIKESLLLNLMKKGNNLDKFAGSIFVTFNTVKDKEGFYNKFPHFFLEKVFNKFKNIRNCFICDKEKRKKIYLRNKINVQYANEPEDIIWENLEYTNCQRLARKLFIYFISIILLLVLFLIVFKLSSIQNDLQNKNNWRYIIINLVSFSIALTIVIVNKFFQLLIEFLTKFEKPYSFTHFYLSCSIKLTIFAFITSSFIPFICNIYSKGPKDNNLMIKNISNLFIINAITLPLPVILIKYSFKIFRIWLIKRNPKSIYMTQRELNDLYELPDMCISYRYSDVSQTILMTFFYMPIFPFGAIISAIGLIMTFYCEKFYFIHFYKRPEMLNESICKFYLEFFIFNILVYAIGDYIFSNEIYGKNYFRLFNIIIFSILTIVPYNKFILLYLGNKNLVQINATIPISKAYFRFFNDYERQNPITKKEGLLKYINALRERKLISENVKKLASDNVDNINIMEVYYKSSLRYSVIKSQLHFIDNQKEYRCAKTTKNVDDELYKSEDEHNKNNDKNKYKNSEEKDYNNVDNKYIEKTQLIEVKDFKEIIKNNNSLMLCSYNNPFLFGINDSIRASINAQENLAICANNNNNNVNNINNNTTNIIVEESKEEDLYNNSGLINLDKIKEIKTIRSETIDSQIDLEEKKIYKEFSKKNKLYKTISYKKQKKNSIKDLSSTNDYLNEIIKEPKEANFENPSKSVMLNNKKNEE